MAGIALFLAAWAIVFGGLALAYLTAGEIYEYEDTVDGVRLPTVDAIVCLAGGRGRIAAAGDLWYRYFEQSKSPGGRKPPILYISGMGPLSDWSVFRAQLRRGVSEVIKPESVVLETESSNTDENAQWLDRYARERGWKRILLITSGYHMRRALHIFEHVVNKSGRQDAPKIRIETFSFHQEPFEPGEWRTGFQGVRVTVAEYLKGIYYRFFWLPVVSPAPRSN